MEPGESAGSSGSFVGEARSLVLAKRLQSPKWRSISLGTTVLWRPLDLKGRVLPGSFILALQNDLGFSRGDKRGD